MARAVAAYRDRDEAGDLLASRLRAYGGRPCVVLAIPNGGVPVSIRVREALAADLNLLVVRKLHIPWNPEAGFGAVAPDGTVVFNETLRGALGLSDAEEAAIVREEVAAISRRQEAYGAKGLPPLAGRTAILVDDGLASGYSMTAAVRFVRGQHPNEVVVAVPTASGAAVALVSHEADAVVCPNVRGGAVFAVADAYLTWRDISDEEVVALLRAAGVRKG